MQALIERAEKGGSYVVDVSLNYYSQWLVNECGTYPEEVWKELWETKGQPKFRHYDNMQATIPALIGMLLKHASDTVLSAENFENRHSKAIGCTVRTPKTIIQWQDDKVEPGYNVGTRGNGVDKPYWPKDLSVEIVA